MVKSGFRIDKTSLEKLIEQGKKHYILYPNGKIALEVKELLVHLGAEVDFYIDNKNYNGREVLNIEQAQSKGIENAYILITSDQDLIYEVIRKNIYAAFPKEQILDLFPKFEIMEEDVDHCILDLEEYVRSVGEQC